ncbi:MAG TPA: glycosyltransferase family 2 protein [Ignavibacteriaceae bacterium]|nr:glycosyltransferase family 2 protein [Ignavibacteriaceae bacterium]
MISIQLRLKKKKALLILVVLGVLSSFYYLSWWFEQYRFNNPLVAFGFICILFYIVTQVYFLWYIFLHSKYPKKKTATRTFSVDVILPTYNEPEWLVEKACCAMVNMKYPHKTYLVDDGNNPAYKKIAERNGAIYYSRKDKKDFKAGNINNILQNSDGEIIAVFDVDHIPQNNFLDEVIGHFEDPEVGVVQVALDHYNQNESFVSDACCKMNDDFFGATMLGMNGCGSTVVFGSNSVFRREALIKMGGYKPGLAEDLNTSIHLHADGWKSVYVPQILAQGLVPADLGAFFKQQIKWSRGVFESLITLYPKLFKHLSLRKRICYLTRMTYYLAGPVVAFHIAFCALALFSPEINAQFRNYILHSIPFLFMFFIIQVFTKNFYFIKRQKKGFNAEGYILVLGTWPVYTFAFLSALLRIKIPFIATPKNKTNLMDNLVLIIPQLITVLVLLAGIIYKISTGVLSNPSFTILFALVMILLHSGVFFAVWESYVFNKKRKSTQEENYSEIITDNGHDVNFVGSKQVQQKPI